MESLSRPFHSRKLSNATTFSAKNAYDGVFSGHRHNYAGASPINLEDYREIFSSSPAASSIPMLNLSTLVEQSDAFNLNLNLNLRSSNSKPDYSKIFGGFRDEDVAVSYEELFAGDKSRAPSSKTSSSSDSDHLSHQSSESLKQFNMSYNKITQKSKDGLDETRYVKELHAIPGFTRFIDEAVPPLMEDKKHESSADHVSVDSSKRSKHHSGEILFEDTKFKTFDNVKVHLSTVSSASASPISRKDYPKRSTSINFDSSKGPRGFSPAYNDEEVNMNSAASDSGAALKKAIEKAQESIRIAKESVGRKKKGLRSFSSKTFKDSLNVEGRVKDVTASEAQRCKDEVREVFERATTSSQGFSEVGKTRKYFMDSEKLFVAKKFIDEMHGKISESTKECSMSVESCNKMKDNTIVSGSAQVMDETECRPLETAEKDEYATFHPEAVDTEKGRIESLDFLADQIYIYEGKMKATAVYNSTQVTGETVEVDMSRESKENKDEVRLSNAHEIVKELNNLSVSQKAEDEKRVPQEEVLEQECIENAEEIEMHRRNSDDDISDIGLEDGNESKDDCTTDNTIHESKEGAQSCDDNLEESEASLQDDCEMKQEDNHRGERKGESSDNFSDQELDEILSGDDNVSEETYSADGIHVASNIVVDTHESCKVDMNDNNVETTQETDTCFAQIGTEEQSESSSWEEEEEEEEQQQQQQQQQSNIQLSQEEIPETESINEIQESQEPLYKKEKTMEDTEEMRTSEDKEKENEIRETGPSKAVGTENKERIDEVAARELEREKDRLAVDRAIREARERARERVERAAVEKATEEIRQRMMADAREKACAEARERAERAAVEKATEEIRQRMRADAREKAAKASAQSKLRAERAAVERATSEARQRALEKAMSKKPLQEDSSGSNGTSSESALRKAKLEKDNKIMERTAKALAEKEKRDLLAQKEQAERNRLAENLDADIKKWSSGKEGNLRALLSTLHNILGSESGWQPVTLAEIVATSAVKKAYRKATLCVHPDKLQQRGASIQHKYICEKVFDLLKAAWNKFNSEKR